MIGIEESEPVHPGAEKPDFPKHSLEVPELIYCTWFYPLGFPTELRTNSLEVLALADRMWSMFDKQFETRPIRVDIHVLEGGSTTCPPTPIVRIAKPLVINVADAENYSVADLAQLTTQVIVARSTLRHRSYLEYFLLGGAPLCHIATAHSTPIHAACVTRHGRGMLLCGESGAGKSSLAYACARAGWAYTSDDASYLLNDGRCRMVTGNCHQVRFRPSAADLFPEVNGFSITPRAAGKPSVEMPTANLSWITCSPTTDVDFLVFLNRKAPAPPGLVPYPLDAARDSLRQVLFGMPETLERQNASLQRLLAAQTLELRYSDLGWAVQRLETLTREGC